MREQNKDHNYYDILLTVKDAFKEDSGKGRIRIDPEVVKKLKIETGDAIEIFHPISKSKTAALLFPGKSEDSGTDFIRLDPFLRRNIKATMDDRVKIRKIKAAIAEKLVFASLTKSVVFNPKQLNRELENRVVTIGDILSFYHYQKTYDVVVVDFQPKTDAVRIHIDTDIRLSEITHKELIERERARVSYEDIGGLTDEIQRIREMIELPKKHPELFQRFGIDPPKGILLYGPSGTGKTLLTRAIAFQTDAHIITISGPEIMSKYYGQTAQNLRNTFDEAKKNAPSIIVIDEIDSIASTKESINATVENRMISQLLSLLDGFYDRGGIIVIGLTNKLELLEPALLSPGRFDTIIEFTLPDEKGREEIFKIHTKRMPLERIISIKDLANHTQNFTGADISAVCKEASLSALRRHLPQNYLDSDIIDVGVVNQIEITQNDFDQAIKIVSKNINLRLKLIENKNIKSDLH